MRNVRPGTGSALLGLAAIALLGATLLAVLVSRSVAGPGSGANDARFGWQAASKSPGAAALARPVALGSGLVVFTSDGSAEVIGNVSASAWSSSDGSNWSRLSQPGAIAEPGRSITLVAACPDGHGGLVVAGTSAIASDPTLALQATIWHSPDGRTWDLATVDGDVGASVEDVAAGADALVAVGLAQPSNAGTSLGLAWYSGDGMTWHPASVSDSDGYSLLAVEAWLGEFVAIGSGTGGRKPPRVGWPSGPSSDIGYTGCARHQCTVHGAASPGFGSPISMNKVARRPFTSCAVTMSEASVERPIHCRRWSMSKLSVMTI